MTAMLTDDYAREYDHAQDTAKLSFFGRIVTRCGYKIFIDHVIHLLYGGKVKHSFATIAEAYNFAQKL